MRWTGLPATRSATAARRAAAARGSTVLSGAARPSVRVVPVKCSTRRRASRPGWSMPAPASVRRVSASSAPSVSLPRVSAVSMAVDQKLRLMIGNQRVDDLVELAFHDPVELVQREVDAMVRHPALGEVVGADALGTVAGSHLQQPRLRALVRRLHALQVEQAGAQNLHGARTVLVLRLLRLRNDDAGRQMRYANGRIGRVDVLAA